MWLSRIEDRIYPAWVEGVAIQGAGGPPRAADRRKMSLLTCRKLRLWFGIDSGTLIR